MRLSDDKVNHLSHLVAEGLKKSEKVKLLKSKNTIRLKIREIIKTELMLDDEIDTIVRGKISKKIHEGSREWDIIYSKLFEEELAKRGR